MSEADERLPAGPPGEKGDPGERGLSRLQGRAVVVLFVIAVILGVGNLFWSSHQVNAEQGKWCGLVVTLDKADEAAKQQPAAGTFTAQLVTEIHSLRSELGCEP